MTDYWVQIEEQQFHVAFDGAKPTLDGVPSDFQLLHADKSGTHLIQCGNRVMEYFVKPDTNQNYQVCFNGLVLNAEIHSGDKPAPVQQEEESGNTVKAPMPGVVVEIKVQPGDIVESGQVVLVLESMKMQMQIRAGKTGPVEAILVNSGDQVEKSQLLVQIQ